ncbi:hypothetical protein BMF94_1397 [Rhodotorula taiwanensis]|uniref:Uncharacterized protein n=1 Tax=Rhodotorula taiwanensis TaxID=741276 RepID=A0A2S5BFE9_9BASI|nr:hypothetical protein BMF94_1397 [Rhodotorula taiwanensis]
MPGPEAQGYESLAPVAKQVEVRHGQRWVPPRRLVIAIALAASVVAVLSVALAHPAYKLPAFGTTSYRRVRASTASKCSSLELASRRNNGSFWVVEAVQTRMPELVIRPRDNSFEGCFGAASAYFTVRIHYGNETQVLGGPSYQDPLGVYHYDAFPRGLEMPGTDEGVLEAKLDFGYYPAAEDGQPCSLPVCNVEEVARTGVLYSGEEILDATGQRVTLRVNNRPTSVNAPAPVCEILDPLPVAFFDATNDFAYADSNGRRCSIRKVGVDLPHRPPLRWIQILGDSNSRYMANQLAVMLNLTLAAKHTANNEKHPTTKIYHDGSGSGIVLAFEWVFVRSSPGDVRDLDAVNLSSLGAYLTSVPFADPPKWPESYTATPVQMTDLFFSFGSHAPTLSQLGMRAGVERLRPGLEQRFALARNRYILLTAATEPSKVPAKYGPQWAMRNNLNIDVAQNAVAREFATSIGALVVDYFTMTRTIPMRLTRDPVHFLTPVYAAQSDILWTALYLADERKRASESGSGSRVDGVIDG